MTDNRERAKEIVNRHNMWKIIHSTRDDSDYELISNITKALDGVRREALETAELDALRLRDGFKNVNDETGAYYADHVADAIRKLMEDE